MWAATFEIFALGVCLLASPIVPDKLENISVFLTSSQALNADIAFLSASCITAFSFFWEIDLKHEDVFLQYLLLIIMAVVSHAYFPGVFTVLYFSASHLHLLMPTISFWVAAPPFLLSTPTNPCTSTGMTHRHSSSPSGPAPPALSRLKELCSRAEIPGSRQIPALQGLLSLGHIHVSQALRGVRLSCSPQEWPGWGKEQEELWSSRGRGAWWPSLRQQPHCSRRKHCHGSHQALGGQGMQCRA